ncbi:MAG: DsbA family protein [Gammaproteobacteria bacterium]|nr:DsbA family protein [Gammaproteobacteria bacterium]
MNDLSRQIKKEPGLADIHSIVAESIQDHQVASKRQLQQNKLTKLKSEFKRADLNASNLIYGNLDARITMVMFDDIECPFCRKIHPELKKIVDNSNGVINWQYKHFPLSIHRAAAAHNAQAVECILETHDNQKAWIALTEFIQTTKGNGRGIDNIVKHSRSIGLNGTLVDFCLQSDAHKNKINNDYALGLSLNVSATPAIQITDNQTKEHLMLTGYLPATAILEKFSH